MRLGSIAGDAVQRHDQDEEHRRQNRRQDTKRSVLPTGLTFTEEGIRAAGDGAGQLLVLAGLQHNRHHKSQRQHKQQDTHNQFDNCHFHDT